jgi:hypothetical protein
MERPFLRLRRSETPVSNLTAHRMNARNGASAPQRVNDAASKFKSNAEPRSDAPAIP